MNKSGVASIICYEHIYIIERIPKFNLRRYSSFTEIDDCIVDNYFIHSKKEESIMGSKVTVKKPVKTMEKQKKN